MIGSQTVITAREEMPSIMEPRISRRGLLDVSGQGRPLKNKAFELRPEKRREGPLGKGNAHAAGKNLM